MTVTEKFWTRVNKTASCWLWTGATMRDGYGHAYVGNYKTDSAHRLSWQIHFGPIPDGKCVCHQCDVPLCVRPDHLFLGSHLENMRDCAAKGRIAGGTALGERNAKSKLTAGQVIEMRKLAATGISCYKLGFMFGISKQAARDIVERNHWKHVA